MVSLRIQQIIGMQLAFRTCPLGSQKHFRGKKKGNQMAGEFPEDRRDVSPDAWREWMLFHTYQRNTLSNERTFLAWVRPAWR